MSVQADVDATFSFESLDKAESFDPKWMNLDAQDVCNLMGSTVIGGLGPFGLLTLASEKLEEYTPVFFRIFKTQEKHKVLMCSDAKRYTCLSVFQSKDVNWSLLNILIWLLIHQGYMFVQQVLFG